MLTGAGWPQDYAHALLESLGGRVVRRAGQAGGHPARAWAMSGAMALTGRADGQAQLCPLPLASAVEGVVLALDALLVAHGHLPPRWPGVATLSERAAWLGLGRQGSRSAGGASRLLKAADGWFSLSLPRLDDWALLPALLEADCPLPENMEDGRLTAAWQLLQSRVSVYSAPELVARARLMGLSAAAVLPLPELWSAQPPAALPEPPSSSGWFSCQSVPTMRADAMQQRKRPLVVDLSALWAGPLCTHLLQLAGARVIKVESLQRPDGARQGVAGFFDLMHYGKQSVALDFASARGRAQLQALIACADIVIEASRPRALRQLGIDAEALVAARPGLGWVALSGYGRTGQQADWIAYGDDAAVAAGLGSVLQALTGAPMYCGDAIADPLTGWHAALAALAAWLGGGGLFSLSLVDVVRHAAGLHLPTSQTALAARAAEWQDYLCQQALTAMLPQARVAPGPAARLGRDTGAVLAKLGMPC